ncbi:MAG: hypothetical protein ABIJ97_11645 [Bacteroidota bacterium]
MQDKIVSVNRATKKKPATITIELIHSSYLPQANRDTEGLVEGLMQQMLNSFSIEMPIRGLTLSWDEYTEDFVDE